MLALTGCSTVPMVVPEELLQPCPAPTVDVRDVRGLVRGLGEYHAALESCNDDKAAILRHMKQ